MITQRHIQGFSVFLQSDCVCLVLAVWFALYEDVVDGFTAWPTLVGVRPFVFVSLAVGALTSGMLAAGAVHLLYCLVFAGDTRGTLRTIRFLLVLCWFAAIYSALAFIAFWAWTRMMHPTLVAAEFIILCNAIAALIVLTCSKRQITARG